MPRLLRGVARTAAVAGTATAVSKRVSRRQASRQAQQDTPTQQQPEPLAQPAAPSSMDSKLAQLKELGALRDQGILSDAEFESQKQRILEA